MMGVILDCVVWRKLDEIMGIKRGDIWEQVAALESEVLHDEIE